jgi:hypothetical protein
VEEAAQLPLSAGYINAVMTVINSSHSLLDEFLKCDIKTLRVVPIVHYVRACYALVVLVKLFISASVPTNELGKILDPQLLKIEFYMKALLEIIAKAAGPDNLRVPLKWLIIIQHVSEWYNKSKVGFGRLRKTNYEGLEVSRVAVSTNEVGDGRDIAQCSNGLDAQQSWKMDPFPTISSLKEHASLNMCYDKSISVAPQDSGTSQGNTGSRNVQNTMIAGDEAVDFASFTNEASSLPMADFGAMDFTQDDFSFLDIPGPPPGSFTNWNPNDGMMDMNYEHSTNPWSFDFN